jgi:hypothetical protein
MGGGIHFRGELMKNREAMTRGRRVAEGLTTLLTLGPVTQCEYERIAGRIRKLKKNAPRPQTINRALPNATTTEVEN